MKTRTKEEMQKLVVEALEEAKEELEGLNPAEGTITTIRNSDGTVGSAIILSE